MKIVRIDSDNTASLMADSAWRPHRRPYFVPETDVPVCEIRPVLRIDRLGKAISAKFAHRYIGAWTAACFMRPSTAYDSAVPAGMLDDSLIIGDWHNLPQGQTDISLNGDTAWWGLDATAAAELLARLSQAATFKTGDMIVLPHVLFSFTPVAGTSVKLAAAKSTILEFNIR